MSDPGAQAGPNRSWGQIKGVGDLVFSLAMEIIKGKGQAPIIGNPIDQRLQVEMWMRVRPVSRREGRWK